LEKGAVVCTLEQEKERTLMETLYQQMIFKSRYARYLPEKKRRENWGETITRYWDFMGKHLEEKYSYTPDVKKLYDYIHDLQVMPSMRALMTAGKALERDNVCGYNCAFLPIDDPKSFDEAMFILLCGTGVGFSVERQFINLLPEIPDKLFDSETVIAVRDSKEGWAKALRMLISLLYAGEIPKWDITKVRPAGAPLKTFGGRSSGPGPLTELFKFTVKTFKNAKGRKLTSIECHDLMCKIGEVVVVGGVRRSAMISLSNLSDDRMRHAKSGAWWEANPQRALSNNSAVYSDKPDIGIFMEEWLSLYNSKSGERGIFSREACQKIAARNGRRDPEHTFGTNPCSEIILRPYGFCNLTEVIIRATDAMEDVLAKVEVATIIGTYQSTLTDFPYLRKIWKKNAEEERLLGVSLTGIYDNPLFSSIHSVELDLLLEKLRDHAIEVNNNLASLLGINPAAAITCVKPSGTVSQLVDSASGIHPRHSHYYIRRVRADNKDPLTKFMKESGVPWEPDVMKSDSTTVFSFPIKAPEKAKVRDDISSIEHLELWLKYQRFYCEHKPSVTINVKEDEWMKVGAWVYEHFDEMSGVSFLPHDGGNYRQAPYEEINEEEYNKLLPTIPLSLDWDSLIEIDDNVTATQTLACVSGSCDI
jgi:ribonucleoside-diphosphate reductase alpha chain